MTTATDPLGPEPLALDAPSPPLVQALAYHEAGHGVVGAALGVNVSYLSLQPKAGEWGHLACCMTSGRLVDVLSLDDQIVFWLAGPVSEMTYFPLQRDPSIKRGDVADLYKVVTTLTERFNADHTSPTVVAALERLSRRTIRLVRHHWPWITRVANALALWRRLTGEEIVHLRPGVS